MSVLQVGQLASLRKFKQGDGVFGRYEKGKYQYRRYEAKNGFSYFFGFCEGRLNFVGEHRIVSASTAKELLEAEIFMRGRPQHKADQRLKLYGWATGTSEVFVTIQADDELEGKLRYNIDHQDKLNNCKGT
jgi:hypothetical protein